MIPKAAKNYKAAMDFLDKQAAPEVFKELVIGKEGVDYRTNAKGEYEAILPAFYEHRNTANNYITTAAPVYSQYWLLRAKKDPDQYKAMSQLVFDNGEFLHIEPSSDAPAVVYASIVQPVQLSGKMTEEFMVNSIINGITKAQFDAFANDWKAQCGDQMTTALNTWYKNYKK
jgi:hypothetical protein